MDQTSILWPDQALENVPKCPVCGSGQRTLLHCDLRDKIFFCAPGKWSLYECQDCRCAYLDPRPSSDTIHLAYSQYYTHTSPNEEHLQELNHFQCLRRSMANGYRNWRFKTNLQPANRLGIPMAMIIPSLRHILEHEFRNLPNPNPGARLLDVGFGSGVFLDLARQMGWKVAGVDPDPITVESAAKRGLDVRQGGVEAYADMPESFDVITLSHVIEHVHDPLQTLQAIFRLLKPGGFLWLSTPNIQSFGHEYYGKHWRGLEPPRHLVLFNWHTLCEKLIQIGFKSIQKNYQNNHFIFLAAQSESISRGLNPYSFSKISLRHVMKGFLVIMRTKVHPHRSEFITLKAYKV